ncbi:MAG: response regulator transcription factor [Candidatus Dojkabacteria bacterium]
MSKKKRVLVVEDDYNLSQVLEKQLKFWGYEPFTEASGLDGLHNLKQNDTDLLMVDVAIPEMNGIQVLKNIRDRGIDIPVIVMTNYNLETNEIRAYRNGANLFHKKPIKYELLRSQLEMLLTSEIKTREIVLRELEVMPKERLVKVSGKKIELTNKEFDLVYLLIKSPGEAFTRTEIISLIRMGRFEAGEGSVDTLVSRLRRKLGTCAEGEIIETVYGYGYRLNLYFIGTN